MMICNSLLKLSSISITLLMSLGAGPRLEYSPDQNFRWVDKYLTYPSPALTNRPAPSQSLAALMDGDYQFCSQLEPTDWRDGAGVCFIFNKLGHQVEGYYGYPHSDHFICVRGEVEGNQISGEALALSWVGDRWNEIPTSAFEWDAESRLTLARAERIGTSGDAQNPVEWLLFHEAVLNVEGFYQYSSPRMKSPSELCQFL